MLEPTSIAKPLNRSNHRYLTLKAFPLVLYLVLCLFTLESVNIWLLWFYFYPFKNKSIIFLCNHWVL